MLNVDEFAAAIGVTTRTVRAYHARGLLPPPVRAGRTPYYLRGHLVRMRQVLWFQRQGLSLDAVQALLEPDAFLSRVLTVGRGVTEAIRERADLTESMVEGGLLARRADGTVEVCAPRALLLASAQGTSTVAALVRLAEVAEDIAPQADAVLDVLWRANPCPTGNNGLTLEELAALAIEVIRARVTHVVRQQSLLVPPG
ncbi:MerR HTH family regulatory protein [Lentzea waywayandensis]|uniref:MerR HTH family regulatory protein n=1 Tax=Lentzea waywayandensis TaxID=84724 RepID=A0A1I6DL46_9PSEU|nr:MerR family transcriptional regulator [Lentzea waywayandensis]SFR06170.1 MerR HTH family regulatory protein [Lentzea waywayandensis]